MTNWKDYKYLNYLENRSNLKTNSIFINRLTKYVDTIQYNIIKAFVFVYFIYLYYIPIFYWFISYYKEQLLLKKYLNYYSKVIQDTLIDELVNEVVWDVLKEQSNLPTNSDLSSFTKFFLIAGLIVIIGISIYCILKDFNGGNFPGGESKSFEFKKATQQKLEVPYLKSEHFNYDSDKDRFVDSNNEIMFAQHKDLGIIKVEEGFKALPDSKENMLTFTQVALKREDTLVQIEMLNRYQDFLLNLNPRVCIDFNHYKSQKETLFEKWGIIRDFMIDHHCRDHPNDFPYPCLHYLMGRGGNEETTYSWRQRMEKVHNGLKLADFFDGGNRHETFINLLKELNLHISTNLQPATSKLARFPGDNILGQTLIVLDYELDKCVVRVPKLNRLLDLEPDDWIIKDSNLLESLEDEGVFDD